MAKENRSFSAEQREAFAGLILLELMVNQEDFEWPLVPSDEQEVLDTIVQYLHTKGYIEIEEERQAYVPTEAGREHIGYFMKRFSEFLQFYDVFAFVDLSAGAFAHAQYNELNDEQWEALVQQERWEDLRLAVAELKGIDPMEMVFMVSLQDGSFFEGDWEWNLAIGSLWEEMEAIAQSHLSQDDLGETEDEARAVMEDIVQQGSELAIDLLEDVEEVLREEPQDHPEEEGEEEWIEEITTIEYEPNHYAAYRGDPYYRSSFWGRPLW